MSKANEQSDQQAKKRNIEMGKRLEKARNHVGLSARALSHAALRTDTHYGRLIDSMTTGGGAHQKTIDRLVDHLQNLGISRDWLLFGQEPMESPKEASMSDGRRIVDLLIDLDGADRSEAASVVLEIPPEGDPLSLYVRARRLLGSRVSPRPTGVPRPVERAFRAKSEKLREGVTSVPPDGGDEHR